MLDFGREEVRLIYELRLLCLTSPSKWTCTEPIQYLMLFLLLSYILKMRLLELALRHPSQPPLHRFLERWSSTSLLSASPCLSHDIP